MLSRILLWGIVWVPAGPVMAQQIIPLISNGPSLTFTRLREDPNSRCGLLTGSTPARSSPRLSSSSAAVDERTPEQFEQQCRYLASRGMVAITVDYRVASRHKTKAVDAVRDAKSAVRWFRSHAAELMIDPDRIVAAGGSAGGHLAACTGTLNDFDEPDEDHSVSSRPNALVLFNPAVSFHATPDDAEAQKQLKQLPSRLGTEPTGFRRLSTSVIRLRPL